MWLSAVFVVVVWSTGFIVGRYIVGGADPNLSLAARFGTAAMLFFLFCRVARVPLPKGRNLVPHLIAGTIMNGLYLGISYRAVAHGLPPAVMALIGALQPAFTAALAAVVLRTRPDKRFFLGFAVALCGVALVLLPKLRAVEAGIAPGVVAAGVFAILCLSLGTVMQKRLPPTEDPRASFALQNVGGAVTCLILAAAFGEHTFRPTATVVWAWAWAAFVLSGAATFLLIRLVRGFDPARVSTLMLLAPPLAAVQAYFFFNDTLEPVQLAGFAVALLGTAWCRPLKA